MGATAITAIATCIIAVMDKNTNPHARLLVFLFLWSEHKTFAEYGSRGVAKAVGLRVHMATCYFVLLHAITRNE